MSESRPIDEVITELAEHIAFARDRLYSALASMDECAHDLDMAMRAMSGIEIVQNESHSQYAVELSTRAFADSLLALPAKHLLQVIRGAHIHYTRPTPSQLMLLSRWESGTMGRNRKTVLNALMEAIEKASIARGATDG